MNDPMQSSTQGFGVEGRAYILKKSLALPIPQVDGCGGPLLRACFPVILEMSGLGQPDSQNGDVFEAEVKLLNCQDCTEGGTAEQVGTRMPRAAASGWFQDGQILALSFSQGLADVKAIGPLGTDWDGLECHGMPRKS